MTDIKQLRQEADTEPEELAEEFTKTEDAPSPAGNHISISSMAWKIETSSQELKFNELVAWLDYFYNRYINKNGDNKKESYTS